MGGSSTPIRLPSFLIKTLPLIAHSLLALDISANYLASLPLALAACRNLEELDIGTNPLRVLPTWLAVLTNLRVFIADSTGISTIPSTISGAIQLHTLSIRNNRMHALPSWLCLLPALKVVHLAGNPFQGPWKDLIEPLINLPQVTHQEQHQRALRSIMAYLRDMCDLSVGTSSSATAIAAAVVTAQEEVNSSPNVTSALKGSSRRSIAQSPTLASTDNHRFLSESMMTLSTVHPLPTPPPPNVHPPGLFLDRTQSFSNLSGIFSIRDGSTMFGSETGTLIGDSQSLMEKWIGEDRTECVMICKEIVR